MHTESQENKRTSTITHNTNRTDRYCVQSQRTTNTNENESIHHTANHPQHQQPRSDFALGQPTSTSQRQASLPDGRRMSWLFYINTEAAAAAEDEPIRIGMHSRDRTLG